MQLAMDGRSGGYTRGAVRKDVLYNSFRFREFSALISKKQLCATHVSDRLVDRLLAEDMISRADYDACMQALMSSLSQIDLLDNLSAEALYGHIHNVRKAVLGPGVLDALQEKMAKVSTPFIPDGIDQSAKKQALLEANPAVLFAITQGELFAQMAMDIQVAQQAGKTVYVLCGQSGDMLMSEALLTRLLDMPGIHYITHTQDLPKVCLMVYGEEGFTACRGLTVDAIVHGKAAGYHAQAVTGLWGGLNCVVYIPKGMDITQYVPLTQKTRLTYGHLAKLWQDQGDGIYDMTAAQLYQNYPQYFLNIYDVSPSELPISPQFSPEEDTFSQFDRQLDEGLTQYLGGFDNVTFHSAYFDENLQRQPICYDPSQKQPGILVQAGKVNTAAEAKIRSCKKGVTPRQMFRQMGIPGVGLVSNFLFFLTPKLGNLYNQLRADRPLEQADAASGHLDYMLLNGDKRIETFPLFRKTCMGIKQDGSFLFFNFRLGGGQVDISGNTYRWESACVDNDEAHIRLYTPYYSAADESADKDTYRVTVGEGRVNVVILRDTITCIRKGDVVLPSVGVVLSLTEEMAQPLLNKPLENGYYDVSGLKLTVHLDGPEGIRPEDWAQVQWAYGGGLTLIREGVGLCDGQHTDAWFQTEGWTSPLSRQTQESNLHSLVKHPRTAIGCTKDGALVVLVFSGRTWRSTGADYREMISIARSLFPDIHYLMNCDGGGSAMLGMVQDGSFLQLSCPSTSGSSCAGQVRPINTVFYIPAGERK